MCCAMCCAPPCGRWADGIFAATLVCVLPLPVYCRRRSVAAGCVLGLQSSARPLLPSCRPCCCQVRQHCCPPLPPAAGSTLSLSKLPPESVAKIFPRASNTMLYTTPPPAPAPAPFASTPFMVGAAAAVLLCCDMLRCCCVGSSMCVLCMLCCRPGACKAAPCSALPCVP